MSGSSVTIAEIPISTDEDVILGRQRVRAVAQELGFRSLDQTRLVTAASELGRNIVVHAVEGTMTVNRLEEEGKLGIEIIFKDNGPGIPDIDRALTDGYSTAGSMGLGLRGASRLVDDFHIESAPNAGTRVTIRKWV
jgi:serine/threonine-protein kinase RsbT